ncbi:hypothetical protein DFH06DRAFT_1396699 [Mycena polygramma]|nr:hypothetical protein DFH06DRAFT_1396699 [Mycena polygramma]
MQSPFAVQELVDYIIRFLRDSRPDLKTCALVCRSWLYLAQSHLFRQIAISSDSIERWLRILDASPHLNRHIRRLSLGFAINPGGVLRVSEICNFPFTHLKWVRSSDVNLSVQNARALQRLFSLPTLRQIVLTANLDTGKLEVLAEIFRRCSPALQHLDIGATFGSRTLFPEVPDQHIPGSKPSIALTSLMVRHIRIGAATLNGGLHTILHPFTVSTLKALGIMGAPSVEWISLTPVMNSFEILSIDVATNHIGLDLSAFPRLNLLRISLATSLDLPAFERQALSLLSLIMRSLPNRCTILLAMGWLEPTRLQTVRSLFDQALSTCRGLTVDVELPIGQSQVAPHFPELSAKNMLRTVQYNFNWWEDIVLCL